MPVILDTDAALQWLACTPQTAAHRLDLLKPFPAEQMTAYEVSQLVNNGKIDSADLIVCDLGVAVGIGAFGSG